MVETVRVRDVNGAYCQVQVPIGWRVIDTGPSAPGDRYLNVMALIEGATRWEYVDEVQPARHYRLLIRNIEAEASMFEALEVRLSALGP